MNMKEQISESKNRKQIKDRTELKAFGMLHEYANPDLIPLEKNAFGLAMEEKYGRSSESNSSS